MLKSPRTNPTFRGIAHPERLQMERCFHEGLAWNWRPQHPTEEIYQSTLGLLGALPVFDCPESFRQSVTVVIPTHRRVPMGLRHFLNDPAVAMVVILLNGSYAPQIPEHSKITVVRSPWLGHGRTRQKAIEHVKTAFLFFTVDDAIPIGTGAISRLVSEFSVSHWDAIVARQIPWPTAPLYLHRRLLKWMPAGEGSVPFSQSDHVGTLYRTECLKTHPLPDVPIAEDLAWSQGRRIGLCRDALILHSHAPSIAALWDRERQIEAIRCQIKQSQIVKLRTILQHGVGAGFRREWDELIYEGTEALAQWYAQQRFRRRQPIA